MATTTIATLKTEIVRLEKELEKHRRALQILEGGERPQPKPAQPARSTSRPAAKATQPARSTPRPAAKSTPPPSIKGLILEVLRAKAPQKLAPNEISQQLSQQGQRKVNLHNIHSRLSELAKAKTVKRQDGQYWVES